MYYKIIINTYISLLVLDLLWGEGAITVQLAALTQIDNFNLSSESYIHIPFLFYYDFTFTVKETNN